MASLVLTRATGINIDPSCSRTMDPDMTLRGGLADITMAIGGSTGHLGLEEQVLGSSFSFLKLDL